MAWSHSASFIKTSFSENGFLGKSLPLAYALMFLVLFLAQMVLPVLNHLLMTIIIMLDNFYFYNFPRKSIPQGCHCKWPTSCCLLVWTGPRWSWFYGNTSKITIMIMLDNFGFQSFLKKSISGDVRAQVLQEPVGATHADLGRKSRVLPMFRLSGGSRRIKRYPTHMALTSRSLRHRGVSCSNIDNRGVFWRFGGNEGE